VLIISWLVGVTSSLSTSSNTTFSQLERAATPQKMGKNSNLRDFMLFLFLVNSAAKVKLFVKPHKCLPIFFTGECLNNAKIGEFCAFFCHKTTVLELKFFSHVFGLDKNAYLCVHKKNNN
jgi:hypothetical protein